MAPRKQANRGKLEQLNEGEFEQIREAYCQGIMTAREIMENWSLTGSFLRRLRDDFGWSKSFKEAARNNLAKKLAQFDAHKASLEQATRDLMLSGEEDAEPLPSEIMAEEEQLVASAATVAALVAVNHRRKIRKALSVADRLFGELEVTTILSADLEEEWNLLHEGDAKAKSRMAERAFSLPQRMIACNAGAAAMRTLVSLERKAFNMDSEKRDDTDLAKKLHDSVAKSGTSEGGVRERLFAAEREKVAQLNPAQHSEGEEPEDGIEEERKIAVGDWEGLN